MILSEKIKAFRSEKGWTQEDLSKISGVSLPSIKRYETGNNVATTINLKKIADAFEVDLSNFMSPDLSLKNSKIVSQSVSQSQNLSVNMSTNPLNLKKSHKETNIISIPYFEDTYASAGSGVINYDEAPVIMDFDEDFLRKFLRISGNISNMHIINARGDSMEPTITSGELLFINPMQNEGGIVSGCIYIINYDGDVYVKRIEKNPVTKSITLFSDNDKYEPIVIEKYNLTYCHIMGRVVSHMKKA